MLDQTGIFEPDLMEVGGCARDWNDLDLELSNYSQAKAGRKSRMELDISQLHEIEGFLGGCIVDCDKNVTLSSISFGDSIDVDLAGVLNTDVVKATVREMASLGVDDELEDIMISLGEQVHLIRPIGKDASLFVYVAVDRNLCNLALARNTVRAVEGTLRLS